MIRVISGDQESAALDFQKHYRMPVVFLLDPDRAFERRYNRDGWPFLVLADGDGNIVYRCNSLVDREKELMRLLNQFKSTPAAASTQAADGVTYMAATLERAGTDRKSERFCSMAAGKDGTVYTVYTAVVDGSSNIYVRVGGDPNGVRDIPVAATEADEYDATVHVSGDGQTWMCWTSNAMGNKYQVYVNSLRRLEAGEKDILVSRSKEDCMHGRMTSDASGTLWIAYYQWHLMSGTSRDKEVYVRTCGPDGRLSEAVRVSPTDVPAYEDHTDPSIAMLGDQAMVCWSWDFHQPDGYTREARSPTIFTRPIGAGLRPGKIFHLSGPNIETMPVFSPACGEHLWCAWDSLGKKKSLQLRRLTSQAGAGETITLADSLVNLCSPAFAADADRCAMTWSQTANGTDWTLMRADYNPTGGAWSRPVVVMKEGNPRFGGCVYDADGQLWIACSVETEAGREIKVWKAGE